ncbi:MAG TPA: membrane protein insertase YidC [Bacteroidales bacterium]|nr:membrane protein insertase YidC [Bacteroidales bacterium]
MDKNSIIGIIIIVGVLVIYSIINKPSEEERERRERMVDSLKAIQQEQVEREKALLKEQDSLKNIPVNLDDIASKQLLVQELGDFAIAATGENEFYTIENELLKLTVSSKGGRPYSVMLKNYKTSDSKPLILFSGDSTIFGFNFGYQNRIISTNDLFFTPSAEEKNLYTEGDSVSLAMRLDAGDSRYLEYVYTMYKGEYMVGFRINLVGLGDISTSLSESIDLNWEMYASQQENNKKNENIYTTIYYKPYEDDVDYFRSRTGKDKQSEEMPTKVEWVAFKNQFFSSVLIADKPFENATIEYINLPEEDKFLKKFMAEIGVPFSHSADESVDLKFYFGPNKFNLLKKYKEYELKDLVTVGRGVIKWINQFVIISIFDWLSKFIGNYGIIILLLTIIIKVGLFPLTYRSYLSQAKMKVLKPQIDELNKKYPKGKEMEKQQATMALYKKAGASPFGGCLPQLLQFPILFAMFRFFPTSIELRQESFLWAKDLSTYDSILDLPFNLPLGYGDHVSLFTLLMTVSTIISMRISSQSTASTQQMPGMKMMMYIMPVMFMFILNSFSAALTYYYFLANMITFGQNWIFKQFIDEEQLLSKMQARQAKPKKKSGWQQRMEKMARDRGYRPPAKKSSKPARKK